MSHVQTPQQAGSLKALMDAYERQLILAALGAAAGNQRRAARALGLLPTTLHEKMKRLGIRRREPQPPRYADEDGTEPSAPRHAGIEADQGRSRPDRVSDPVA